jgi:hypothetical protein
MCIMAAPETQVIRHVVILTGALAHKGTIAVEVWACHLEAAVLPATVGEVSMRSDPVLKSIDYETDGRQWGAQGGSRPLCKLRRAPKPLLERCQFHDVAEEFHFFIAI